nr:transposase [Pseudactinotalea sp. HY158]
MPDLPPAPDRGARPEQRRPSPRPGPTQPAPREGSRPGGVRDHPGRPDPIIDQSGPARLLDVKAGRSAKVLEDWLDQRDQCFRDPVDVVTVDGFTSYRSTTNAALPDAAAVIALAA